MKRRSSYGVYELIVGILLILLGIFTFTRPQSALTGLVVLYGLLATITGIGDIVFYVKMEKHTGFGPTISLIINSLGLALGFLMLIKPYYSLLSITFMIGVYLILLGLDSLGEAFSRMGENW